MMQTNFVLHKHVSKEEEVKVLNLHQQVVPKEESSLRPRTLKPLLKSCPRLEKICDEEPGS